MLTLINIMHTFKRVKWSLSLIEFVDKFNFNTEEVVDVTEDSAPEEEVKE